MHELAVTREIVDVAAEKAEGARVRRVVIEIGRLTPVAPDCVRFYFEICAAGTAVEGAELEIREIAGNARCRACEASLELAGPVEGCGCGSFDLEILAGRELRLMELEVY
ncbi:MAG: hydrogenase maturation nickel metallochaperone HypA [Candidatus Wallbacteria bacterium]|nr:hydrogenase maturation nickel metallochaperone HypA [Candidatus Wallbacteria bacterium]